MKKITLPIFGRLVSKPLTLALFGPLLGSLLSGVSQAQVLVASPSCGTSGSVANITGSGWAEPAPACDYLFYFDGALVASQPDGLFGPPDQNFVVPAGASVGEHTVSVELRITGSNELLQCRKTCFTVTPPATFDPWLGNISVVGNGITVAFDPTNVCSVTPCDKLVMIQTVTNIGVLADGSTRFLSYADYNTTAFGDPALRDADVINGRTVDYVPPELDPYYNGDDSQDNPTQGIQSCAMQVESSIRDAPNCSDGCYPSDIVTIIWDFEVGVFCAQGHNGGEWVGSMKWHWERPLGGTPVASFVSASIDPPSSGFMAALALWDTNHGPFTLPIMGQTTTGGEQCN
jgi:hypothetical protein